MTAASDAERDKPHGWRRVGYALALGAAAAAAGRMTAPKAAPNPFAGIEAELADLLVFTGRVGTALRVISGGMSDEKDPATLCVDQAHLADALVRFAALGRALSAREPRAIVEECETLARILDGMRVHSSLRIAFERHAEVDLLAAITAVDRLRARFTHEPRRPNRYPISSDIDRRPTRYPVS